METYSPSVLACAQPRTRSSELAVVRGCAIQTMWVVPVVGYAFLRFLRFLRFCGVRDRDRVVDRRYTDIPKYDSCRFNQQPDRSIRTPVWIAEQGLKHRSCQAAIHIDA